MKTIPDTDKPALVGKELLKELVDLGGKHARRMLITDCMEQLTPMFHLVGPEGHQIVGGVWTNDTEKYLVVHQVKQIAHQMQANSLMFVTEMWLAREAMPLTPWHAKRQGPYVRPMERPDRQEVVTACAIDNEENYYMKTWQIVRSRPGGPIIALMPSHDSDGSEGNIQIRFNILDGILPKR